MNTRAPFALLLASCLVVGAALVHGGAPTSPPITAEPYESETRSQGGVSYAPVNNNAPTSMLASGQTPITGSASAAQITMGVTCTGGIEVINIDAVNTVYRGAGSSVTNTSGVPLKAGQSWSATGSWATSAQPYWYAPTTLTLAWECFQ